MSAIVVVNQVPLSSQFFEKPNYIDSSYIIQPLISPQSPALRNYFNAESKQYHWNQHHRRLFDKIPDQIISVSRATFPMGGHMKVCARVILQVI